MKLGFVRVFVTDLKKSLDFYTNTLGMEVDYTDNEYWAQFKSGVDVSVAIELCDANLKEKGQPLVGRFAGVTFMVPDVEQMHRDLSAKGVKFTGAPERQPWGGTLAHFEDLDGNILTISQERN